MDVVDILIKDHDSLRGALKSLELHLGPGCGCGWEDQVQLDPAKFHDDLETLSRAFREHKNFEEKFAEDWLRQSPEPNSAVEKILLESHKSIDALLKLFATVATLISDGHVHATRTVMSRLREELARHMNEEESGLFPLLRNRKRAGASSGA